MNKRKHNDSVDFSNISYSALLDYDFYKRAKPRDKKKIDTTYLEHAHCLYKKTNERSAGLSSKKIVFDTDDQKEAFFLRIKELSNQILDFLFQQGESREYNLKIVGGALSSYTIIYLTRYSLLNLLCYSDTHRRDFLDYNYLKNNFLMYFDNRSIFNLSQMEILTQLQGLQKGWKFLDLNSQLIDLFNTIELRIAFIICNRFNSQDGIINESNDLFSRKIEINPQGDYVLICTPIFIERVTCIISSLRSLIMIIPFLKTMYTQGTSNFFSFY